MNKRLFWNTIFLKVRYGWKSYILFLSATILFVTLYFLELCFMDSEELAKNQNLYMIVFLYIPVSINQALQSVEYSKCYYLVPRTKEERKKFIIMENMFKMVISIVSVTVLLGAGAAIRPEAFEFLLNWYLLCGIGFTIVIGCNGYSTYRTRRRRLSYRGYMITYTITVVVMITILCCGMFLINPDSITQWIRGAFGVVGLSIVYHLYYLCKFIKTEAVYDLIDKDERRFVTRMSNTMM